MRFKSNNELDFLDAITIISFLVGLENLDLNVTQGDLQTVSGQLDESLRKEVAYIHRHLEEQDAKIDLILKNLMKEGKK